MRHFVLVGLVLLTSCAAWQRGAVVNSSTDACVAIARAYCRPDIAAICQTVKDVAPLIEQLLADKQAAERYGACQ